ncbi:hypothetical protein LSAT2_010904 [Lamellibrachia satsuma]|nr:hypothetical protein LSAT2_010904 [Lamellibrachia satsuma]
MSYTYIEPKKHSLFQTGRDYKLVTNRPNGAYGEAALEEALNALQHGESYRSIEREYGVPRHTLQRHHKDQVRAPGRIQLGGSEKYLLKDGVHFNQEGNRKYYNSVRASVIAAANKLT